MKLKDILLVSDIDGTLIDSQYEIPPRNREAILRFMKKGGGFAIATGRSWESVLVCLGNLKVNRPCVLANGRTGLGFKLSQSPFGTGPAENGLSVYLPDYGKIPQSWNRNFTPRVYGCSGK